EEIVYRNGADRNGREERGTVTPRPGRGRRRSQREEHRGHRGRKKEGRKERKKKRLTQRSQRAQNSQRRKNQGGKEEEVRRQRVKAHPSRQRREGWGTRRQGSKFSVVSFKFRRRETQEKPQA